MRTAFKAPRLLGLLAIVAGAMVFGATAAQAEPGAYWLVNGTDIGESLLPEVQAKNDGTDFAISTKIGATSLDLLCSTISLKGAKLHELGRATGRIHYEGCTTLLNGKTSNACKPKSPGATAGLIETNPLEALLKLHELAGGAKDELLELVPSEGTSFVTIELGALCAIGNKFAITGKAFIEDCLDEALVDREEHLVEEGPLTVLLFGSNPASVISGSAFVFLEGAHKGMTFAGHAA
jgi:hypothetical protein